MSTLVLNDTIFIHSPSSDKFTLVICFNDNQPDTFCWTKMPSVAMMNCSNCEYQGGRMTLINV